MKKLMTAKEALELFNARENPIIDEKVIIQFNELVKQAVKNGHRYVKVADINSISSKLTDKEKAAFNRMIQQNGFVESNQSGRWRF